MRFCNHFLGWIKLWIRNIFAEMTSSFISWCCYWIWRDKNLPLRRLSASDVAWGHRFGVGLRARSSHSLLMLKFLCSNSLWQHFNWKTGNYISPLNISVTKTNSGILSVKGVGMLVVSFTGVNYGSLRVFRTERRCFCPYHPGIV